MPSLVRRADVLQNGLVCLVLQSVCFATGYIHRLQDLVFLPHPNTSFFNLNLIFSRAWAANNSQLFSLIVTRQLRFILIGFGVGFRCLIQVWNGIFLFDLVYFRLFLGFIFGVSRSRCLVGSCRIRRSVAAKKCYANDATKSQLPNRIVHLAVFPFNWSVKSLRGTRLQTSPESRCQSNRTKRLPHTRLQRFLPCSRWHRQRRLR